MNLSNSDPKTPQSQEFPKASHGHMVGWSVERMQMERAIDFWFHGDLTVLYKISPGGEIVALPNVEVRRSLNALNLLLNCQDYHDLAYLERKLEVQGEAPQLFPYLPLLLEFEEAIDLVLESAYLIGTGREHSIIELLAEKLGFVPPEDPEAFFKDPGDEHLLSDGEKYILQAKTDLLFRTPFDVMTCPLFRDPTGKHLLFTDFRKETSLWVPSEIVEDAGKRWAYFDTDHSVSEYSFYDLALLKETFAEFGVEMIEARDEFRALSTFKVTHVSGS
jgi:hypothetical protein